MTHPEELLAGYVDGTLSAEERVAVETHLAGCARCSRDIELADERPVGPQVDDRGAGSCRHRLAGAPGSRGGSTGRRAGGTPRWYRVGGMVAAVAAGLLVFSLVLPNIGQNDASDRDTAAAKAEDAAGGGAGGAVATLRGHADRDPAGRTTTTRRLTGFTSSYRTVADGSVEMGTAEAPVAPVFGTPGADRQGAGVRRRSPPRGETETLQHLIRARFEGTPAYFAVFFESREPTNPSTGSRLGLRDRDCGILSFSPRRCSAATLHRAAARRE